MSSDDDGEPDAPDINAQIAALATGLAGLQTAVTQLVTAVNDNVTETNRRVQFASDEAQARADAAGAGAAPPQPGRNPLVEAIEKLAHPTPKEVYGQTIRPFDFDHTADPPGVFFSLPSEPYHPPNQATIIKNESHLFKTIQRNRVDPREASPSYYLKVFSDHVGTPHKQAVLMHSSYEDYIRGTNMYYAGMQVWFSRLTAGGALAEWLDDSSPLTLWNTFTKETIKVSRYAFDGHGNKSGMRGYQTYLKRCLDEGLPLDQPAQHHRSLRAQIDTHNAKPQAQRKLPVLQEFQDWGVQKERGERYPADDPEHPAELGVAQIKYESGGYVQCNPSYDRNLVLSRGEFRALSLVLGGAFHRFCQKGVTSETGRTDDLLCAAAQNDLTRTLCPNYAWEMMKAYTEAYPESQEDLVMRIRSAVRAFKFDKAQIKLSMYIAQYQLAQAALVRHGDGTSSITDERILYDVATLLHEHFSVLDPQESDSLNLAYKELAESYNQRNVLSADHKHKHVFETLSKLKQQILTIEDRHPHAARSESVPVYLFVPTPRERQRQRSTFVSIPVRLTRWDESLRPPTGRMT